MATISQKMIFRKPLKFWSIFTLHIKTVGWDDKWIYNVQRFEQNGETKALCVSRSLVWKKDKPQILSEIFEAMGVTELTKTPPDWVKAVFENDADILNKHI